MSLTPEEWKRAVLDRIGTYQTNGLIVPMCDLTGDYDQTAKRIESTITISTRFEPSEPE